MNDEDITLGIGTELGDREGVFLGPQSTAQYFGTKSRPKVMLFHTSSGQT